VKLHRILIDENERLKAIDIAFKVVNQTIESYKMKYPNTNVKELFRTKNFTIELIEEAKKYQPTSK
jgi:hypothetical protein